MDVLMQQLGIMLFMVLIGIFAQKRGILHDEAQDGVRGLILRIAVPMMILGASEVGGDGDMRARLLLVFLIAVSYLATLAVLGRVLSNGAHLDKKRAAAFQVSLIQGNAGFVSLPLCAALFGAEGAFYCSICNVVSMTCTFSYGYGLISGSKGIRWRQILLNPSGLAAYALVFIVLFQLKLPSFVIASFKSLGALCTPLSMLLMGAMLAEIKPHEFFNVKMAYPVSLLRLFIMPLLLMLVLWLCKAPRVFALALVVFAAPPCGALNCMLARQFDCEPLLFSQITAQTMLFCLASLPLLLMIGSALFPA